MRVRRHWYHPAAIMGSLVVRPRVYLGALVGILTYFACPLGWATTERISVAWDAGALIYLFLAFRLMTLNQMDRVRKVAAAGDDSRIVILIIILLSICASFVAIAQLVGQAKAAGPAGSLKIWLAGLAAVTIIISWIVTQVAFTLHYAHEFYMPGKGSDAAGGLDFAGVKEPDYWDFLYFATAIGATSQTSDTSIRSHNLRRLVTLHAIVAFFFNTTVLALTVNIAASLA